MGSTPNDSSKPHGTGNCTRGTDQRRGLDDVSIVMVWPVFGSRMVMELPAPCHGRETLHERIQAISTRIVVNEITPSRAPPRKRHGLCYPTEPSACFGVAAMVLASCPTKRHRASCPTSRSRGSFHEQPETKPSVGPAWRPWRRRPPRLRASQRVHWFHIVSHPGMPHVYVWTKRLFEISLATVEISRGGRI